MIIYKVYGVDNKIVLDRRKHALTNALFNKNLYYFLQDIYI
jgi:hypothetical protein